jgi:hypothetical protein
MTLTIDLPDEQNAALAAKARDQGLSAEQYARQVIVHDLEAPNPPRRRHIWEVIAENMKSVPREELLPCLTTASVRLTTTFTAYPDPEP